MKRRRRQHRSAAVCSASARGRVRRPCRRAQAGSTPVRDAQHSSGNPRRLACSWQAGSHVMEAMEATLEADTRTLADVATHR